MFRFKECDCQVLHIWHRHTQHKEKPLHGWRNITEVSEAQAVPPALVSGWGDGKVELRFVGFALLMHPTYLGWGQN